VSGWCNSGSTVTASPSPPLIRGGECAVEIRAFFAHDDGAVSEDPVTGSLNASVAQWLLSTGTLAAPYVASQGTALGRRGRIYIDQDSDETIWVGGIATASIAGEITI